MQLIFPETCAHKPEWSDSVVDSDDDDVTVGSEIESRVHGTGAKEVGATVHPHHHGEVITNAVRSYDLI